MGVVLCWLYAGKSLSLWCFAGFCGRMFALLLCWLHSGNTCSLYHSIALWLHTGYHWISLVAPGVPRCLAPWALGPWEIRALGMPWAPHSCADGQHIYTTSGLHHQSEKSETLLDVLISGACVPRGLSERLVCDTMCLGSRFFASWVPCSLFSGL
jgi:hypothetical protein